MSKFFTLMLNLIFFIYVIGIFFLNYIGLSIIPSRVLTYGILLLLIGICLSSNNKKIKVFGLIITIVNFIYIISIGYYDSLISSKFDTIKTSWYIAISITMYYLLIFLGKNLITKTKK